MTSRLSGLSAAGIAVSANYVSFLWVAFFFNSLTFWRSVLGPPLILGNPSRIHPGINLQYLAAELVTCKPLGLYKSTITEQLTFLELRNAATRASKGSDSATYTYIYIYNVYPSSP